MTGMTDISRHGGDKKYRDELDIKVKDDALVDPEFLGVTSSYPVATDNLVDDSEDDDDYEVGYSGPGMAAQVVQTGFKLLFFPLMLAYRALILLKHLPWLFGRMGHGIKTAPASIKHIGTVFQRLSSGRLSKVLLVIGTWTGVIWVSRKIAALGASVSAKRQAKRLAAEEASLEEQIRSEEAAKKPATVSVQPVNGHRKATASAQFSQSQPQSQQPQPTTIAINTQKKQPRAEPQTNLPEHEEPKTRKKIGFGQLSKLASAFKRSEPVTSSDTASPNEDSYDSFDATGNRWGAKKSAFFAAACIVLLIGGLSVARQVMQKNSGDDVAANTPDDDSQVKDTNVNKDSKTKDETPKSDPTSFGYHPSSLFASENDTNNNPWTRQSSVGRDVSAGGYSPDVVPAMSVPAASQVSGGIPNFAANNQPVSNNIAFVEPGASPYSPPAAYDEPDDDELQDAVVVNDGYGGQGSGLSVTVHSDDDFDGPVADNDGMFAAANPMAQSDTGTTGYGHDFAAGNAFPASVSSYDDEPSYFPMPPSPMSGTQLAALPMSGAAGNFGLTSGNLATDDELSATPAQTVLPNNSSSLFALDGMSQGGTDMASASQPSVAESFTLAATPRVSQDRSFASQPEQFEPYDMPQPSTQSGMFGLSSQDREPVFEPAYENAAPLVTVWGNSSQTSVDNNFGLAATDSTIPAPFGMVNEQNERDAWNGLHDDPIASVDENRFQPPASSQPSGEFSLAQNDAPMQTPNQGRIIAPVAAPAEPIMSSAPIPVNNAMLSENQPASTGMFGLSQPSPASVQAPIPMQPSMQAAAQTQPPAPVAIQQSLMTSSVSPTATVNLTASAMPLALPAAVQENIGGIVSPSAQSAAMQMVSPNPQATTMPFAPPTGVNAEPAPIYAARPQAFQGVAQEPAQQQFASPMTAVQPVSIEQNNVYIVQPGDNIYKIAKQELGSVKRYREIYDLNRERLPIGQDTLTAGMELLLPTRM